MINSSFPFTSPFVYFDGAAYSTSSIGQIVFQLTKHLRLQGVPVFTKRLSAGAFYEDFFEARHFAVDLPKISGLSEEKYIYINPGWDYEEHLAIHAKQSVNILAIDDFRGYRLRSAARHYDTVTSFSKFSVAWLKKILKRNVEYFPLGVDTKAFFPIQNPVLPHLEFLFKNFNFTLQDFEGYVFFNTNFHQPRKGTDELLEAYYKAFYGVPNVMLHIHGPQIAWADKNESRGLSRFKDSPHAPLVAWTTNLLRTAQLNQLTNFADCYVSPHHLEGFGLGPLQALACNKAVIATAASGPMDYLSKDNAYLLPCTETTKQVLDLGKFPWANYKLDDLIDLMRALPKAKPGALTTARSFPWEKSAKIFGSLLQGCGKILYPSKQKTCTLCIPCKNDAQMLEACLLSIIKHDPGYPLEKLVVNDGNSSEVTKVCRSYGVQELIIPASKGLSHARNIGLSGINTEYTLFFDSDIEVVEAHWLSTWIRGHEASRATISTVLQLNKDGTINFQAGMPIGERTGFNCPPTIASETRAKLQYVQGSAMLINTKVAQQFGFCEDYTYYYDDVDFCRYLQENGHDVLYIPLTHLIHKSSEFRKDKSTLSPRDLGKSTYESYWNLGLIPAL